MIAVRASTMAVGLPQQSVPCCGQRQRSTGYANCLVHANSLTAFGVAIPSKLGQCWSQSMMSQIGRQTRLPGGGLYDPQNLNIISVLERFGGLP